MSELTKGRIVFLDYMRVFAFISVLIGHNFYDALDHVTSDPSIHITLRYIAEFLLPLCKGGAAGVFVFFLTSGYIITHVLQTEAPREFLLKRIFRIYPLYIFAVILEAAFSTWIDGQTLEPIKVLIPRILLIGDLFNTPYSLSGVEWTLRLEVAFYLMMSLVKVSGLINLSKTLTLTYLIIASGLYATTPFPMVVPWSFGYFNIYAPILLIGSIIYLAERDKSCRALALASIAAMMWMFFLQIAEIQPYWKESNYAIFALAIFLVAFALRYRMKDSASVRLASDLTYAIYLMHKWIWSYLAKVAGMLSLTGYFAQTAQLLMLIAICYLLHITIERFGISLGRSIIRHSKTSRTAIAPLGH